MVIFIHSLIPNFRKVENLICFQFADTLLRLKPSNLVIFVTLYNQSRNLSIKKSYEENFSYLNIEVFVVTIQNVNTATKKMF